MTKDVIISPFAALEKARAYCAYQERCQQEVRDKLYSWKQRPEVVENVIITLIEEKFLNEERYARAFAGGKFRQNQWGKVKIANALKFKQISAYCIKKGLEEIKPQDYDSCLQSLVEKKWNSEKEKHPMKKKYKIAQWLVSRGFESDLVWTAMNQFGSEEM